LTAWRFDGYEIIEVENPGNSGAWEQLATPGTFGAIRLTGVGQYAALLEYVRRRSARKQSDEREFLLLAPVDLDG